MRWELAGGRRLDFGHRVQVVGIVNATPDSFYDGGRHADAEAAADHALALVAQGADWVDVGGESSRPPLYGPLTEVPAAEEVRRVVPVVAAIRRQSDIPLSVDTVKVEVARRALAAGADIVNDISAFEVGGEAMAAAAVAADAPVVLMHRRGSPATMQLDTRYDDLVGEVRGYLAQRVAFAVAHGVAPERVAVDPGLGFGKSAEGSLELLRCAGQFAVDGCPVLIGASRKSFVWRPLGLTPAGALEGSLAAAVLAVVHGARAVRVHDVAATVRAVRLAEAVAGRAPGTPAATDGGRAECSSTS